MFGEYRRLFLEACRGLERDADLARNDMHMQVEHDLPASRLVELPNGEAVGGKRLHGRAANGLHPFDQLGQIVRLDVEEP